MDDRHGPDAGKVKVPEPGRQPGDGPPASPFADALGVTPAELARSAERVMDASHRREVEEAQADKEDALRSRSSDALGEVTDGAVRNPLDRG
jgi:hypothetical protein